MKMLQFFAALVTIAAMLSTDAYAQFAEIGLHARLSDMNNAEANGGGDTSLIGINTGGVNNWGINQWDLSEIAGDTVTEVSLSFVVNQSFANANHGSALDTISVHQLYSTNAGWIEGGQVVNASNVQTGGAATFNFQAQTSATEGTPWQDASGADVANFLGAFDPVAIDSVAGYTEGNGPATIDFTVPIALAQSWVDDPASFAGLVLVANDDGDGRSRFNFVGNPGVLTINPPPAVIVGDVNMDGMVDFLDITPFIAALSGDDAPVEADIDQNGVVDFLDITPFIVLLSS